MCTWPAAREMPARAIWSTSLSRAARRIASSSESARVAGAGCCAAASIGAETASSRPSARARALILAGRVGLTIIGDMVERGRLARDGSPDHAQEAAHVAGGRLVGRQEGVRRHGTSHRVAHDGADEHRDRGLDVGIAIGEPQLVEALDVLGDVTVHVDAAAAGEVRHLGTLLVLADRVDQHWPEVPDALEVHRHPVGELALRIDGRIGEWIDLVAAVVLFEHGVEERALRAEGAEEGDFVDAGFGGDESCSGAAEPVFRVHAGSGFQDSLSADHERMLAKTFAYASTYLLTMRTIFTSSIFGV